MVNRAQAMVAMVVSSVALACGSGGGGGASAPAAGATTSTSTAGRPAASTSTTASPIAGVETFTVEPGHRDGPLTYPQTPPVGGLHNPTWTKCAFYDAAVPSEMAVHSLEHGAIWVTYRPDLPRDELDVLSALARSRKDVVVSRWDEGLPSAVVVTGWGRQLKLTSAADPRLGEFVRAYANQGPEPNAPC